MSLEDLLSLTDQEKVVIFDGLIEFLTTYIPSSVAKPAPSKVVAKSSTKGKSVTGKWDGVESLESKDEDCFSRLKTWRNQVAKDMDWAPYLILDNKTLMAIAHYRPQTEEEFLKIKGIGPEKLGRYYNSILEIVNHQNQRRLHSIPKEPEPEVNDEVEEDLQPITIPRRRFLNPNI